MIYENHVAFFALLFVYVLQIFPCEGKCIKRLEQLLMVGSGL